MAYNDPVPTVEDKGKEVVITISEEDCGTSNEPAAIPLAFAKGRIIGIRCTKTAGSATTVAPVLGRVTDPGNSSNLKDKITEATAAASIDIVPDPPINFYASDGVLYHRSVPDTGSDNDITTEYRILKGWH
jgi:hypothetical protein